MQSHPSPLPSKCRRSSRQVRVIRLSLTLDASITIPEMSIACLHVRYFSIGLGKRDWWWASRFLWQPADVGIKMPRPGPVRKTENAKSAGVVRVAPLSVFSAVINWFFCLPKHDNPFLPPSRHASPRDSAFPSRFCPSSLFPPHQHTATVPPVLLEPHRSLATPYLVTHICFRYFISKLGAPLVDHYSSMRLFSFVGLLACFGTIVDAATVAVEFDLACPHDNQSYAPTPYIPVMLSVWNPKLACDLYPYIEFRTYAN